MNRLRRTHRNWQTSFRIGGNVEVKEIGWEYVDYFEEKRTYGRSRRRWGIFSRP